MSDYRPGNLEETQPYSPTQYAQQETPPAQPVSRGCSWGCLLWGCLGTTLAMGLIIGVSIFAGYRFYQNQITRFTSEAPLELPSAEIADEEVQAIVDRLEAFREQFDKGEAPQELVITIDEINALIAKNPDLRGKVYVTIVDGDLRADVSFPIDDFPGGKGRFFNGSATLHVELDDGVLIANVVSAEANGGPIPEMFMEGFREQNLAKELYKDVEMSKTLKRCEQLTIESDRILLKVRPLQDVPPDQADGQSMEAEASAPNSDDTNSDPAAALQDQADEPQTETEVEAEVDTSDPVESAGGRPE